MTRTSNERDGFALPVAVFALVIVGLLVTGGFYMARQEGRIGIANQKGVTAFYVAERGVSEILESWDPAYFGNIPPMESKARSGATAEGGYRVEVTKLSDWLYFLESRGTVTAGGDILGGATRRVGTLAKIRTIDMRPPAALTTVNGLKLGGSSQVLGGDSIPASWAGQCDPDRNENKPGVLINDASTVEFTGNNYEVEGYPPIQEDPTLTSDELLTFGGLTWEDLVAMRTVTFAGGTNITKTAPDSILSGGDWFCTTNDPYNWGDPLNPYAACGNHFPVIYVAGDLSLQSGDYGQGILLVEGDMKLTGGYTFFGPIVVKGTVSTTGTGGHVTGGLIAANVELSTTTVLGDALVQYSSCTVTRALLNNQGLAIASPLPQRSWVDLSNLGN